MNKYIGIGRITKDIELRTTSNNKSLSQFTIAINEGYGEEQRTNYIDCTVWGKQAENMSKYCSKGSLIAIEGRLQTGSYEDKEGTKRKTTKVVAESIQFLGNKKEENKEQVLEESDLFEEFGDEISDDDLPF